MEVECDEKILHSNKEMVMGQRDRQRLAVAKLLLKEPAERIREHIRHYPAIVWALIRAEWEMKRQLNTTQEYLAGIGFSPDEIATLLPRVALAAKNKLSRMLRQFIQDNPGDILDLCKELEMTLPEFASAIDMPYAEIDRITDEYFGGTP